MKLIRTLLVVAPVAAMLVAASSAEAGGFKFYKDRTAFEAASGATTVEDFTSSYHFPISSGILNSSTSGSFAYGSPLSPGDILPGVTYSTTIGTGFFFNIDSQGGFDGGFLDRLGPGVLTATFDNFQPAFGFDTNGDMGDFVVKAYSDSGQLLFAKHVPAPDQFSFFGFQSGATDIKSLTITGDSAEFGFAIDNMTYGRGSPQPQPPPPPAPEPATWSMMILGAGMIGASLRRRRLERRPGVGSAL